MPRYQIEWASAAETELDEAYQYILSDNTRAADEFLARIDEVVAELEETAHTWDVAHPDERRYLVKQFPYAVIYRMYGDLVVIGVLMHLRRRPGYWKTRRF